MRLLLVKVSVISAVLVGIAVAVTTLMGDSEADSGQSGIPSGTPSLVESILQPGGSASRTGVGEYVGFVVRDSKGNIIESGIATGE